ncbi:hypothetical protein [Streptomyces aurantiogriseus]|uniref:Uncharacterized protein n=1 Tax=Streptomyces aurantiogriseus TaxID=66870 RepID=A0A918C823_9ACTN|nr:hypothetical protein [Streptomyces aurantiogriseus]GGR09866.1 hypothetical protein GCM10010251_27120 [Streptomyces aurantiogriseus]
MVVARTGVFGALTTRNSAAGPMRAYGFDAAAVRELCGNDPELDHALLTHVAGVIADRLGSARVRLLDLYAPHGAGEVP